MTKRISQLTAASALTGTELVEVSQLSASVTITGTTISADSTDNSFNDSANGFVTAGFTTGKSVKVSGFTGNVANNIVSGVVTSAAAGKLIIGGTDGDVIVTDAAGESVTITQWDSKRSTVQGVANKAPSLGREKLSAARTHYVRTDGSDSNDGLANTSGGAFLTIQKAVDVISDTLDMGIYTVTVQCDDATRTSGVTFKRYIGSEAPVILGNTTTPENCVVSTTSSSCFSNPSLLPWVVKGFKLQTTTSGYCFNTIGGGSSILFSNVDFGSSASAHMHAEAGGSIAAATNYTISGSVGAHFEMVENGLINIGGRTVTLTGTPAFSVAFAYGRKGHCLVQSMTFSGSATGPRINLSLCSTVFSNGATEATYFPGNSAGTKLTGSEWY